MVGLASNRGYNEALTLPNVQSNARQSVYIGILELYHCTSHLVHFTITTKDITMKSILTPYEVICSTDDEACRKVANVRGSSIEDVIRDCWKYYYSELNRLGKQGDELSKAILTINRKVDMSAPNYEETRETLKVLRDAVEIRMNHLIHTFNRFANQYPEPPVKRKERTVTSVLHDAYRMAERHPKPTKGPTVGGIFADDYEEHPQPIPPDFTFPTTELAEEYLRQS